MRSLIYASVLCSAFYFSCKSRSTPSSQITAELLSENELKNTLIPQLLTKSTLTFCSKDTSPEIRKQFEKALFVWLEPLKILSDKDLPSAIDFLDQSDPKCSDKKADLNINTKLESGGRAHFNPKQKLIQITESDSYAVILHEMGHAFGLTDTYQENGMVCKTGQPRSVMCAQPLTRWAGSLPELLLPDDLIGVRAAFCKINGPMVEACKNIIPAGIRPNLKKDGTPVFDVGFTVTPPSKACENRGLTIASVTPNSAASRAALTSGMCIGSFNDSPIKSVEEFIKAVQYTHISLIPLSTSQDKGKGMEWKPVLLNAIATDGSGDRPAEVGDLVVGRKGTQLRSADKIVSDLGFDSLCKIIDKKDNWVKIRCHNIPGWVDQSEVEKIIFSNTK